MTAGDDGDGWSALSALPGNPIMWVLIISELVVFGSFLIGFAVMRLLHPAVFHAGQAMLDVRLGGLNTLILVTSGFFAAKAVEAAEADRLRARLWCAAAAASGAGFLAVKSIEYADKFAHGYGLETDAFFTLFFLITGFHAAHVLMGMAVLGLVGWHCSRENLETGAAFWHMVDLVWLLVFPLIYLVR